ncbi:formyltransferase family protein [Tamlana sp. 2201CG12-4]|uniref:formyltransferase family protein n=1 Tax=Tamlana sp. 2201CG12-4 TaxID=3112582 RepID=UPI002DBECAB4|nr:formyltransferase family protein [Tamlana sp. 2201CG12-4]MEC3908021.1 formyltransferase family protein [Tamlana sp. 2201CG12-4]
MENKEKCLDELLTISFDILISNGCPIIFPVKKFKTHQILINIHPTYLPHLQGKTPMNGVFYLKYSFYGATMHYIDKGIDTGDIIHQKKVKLTNDVDLGLLYHLAMKLEGSVFKKGWRKLKKANFKHIGVKQCIESTYFNRNYEMQHLSFKDNTNTLLLKIKSFGIKSQGCIAIINDTKYIIFEAESIIHKPLLKSYKKSKPGEIVLSYDEKFLIKTIDGIIKVKKYEIL